MLREALRVGKISFSMRFFSISMEVEEAKKRIADELKHFGVVKEPGKTFFAKVYARIRTRNTLHFFANHVGSASKSGKLYNNVLFRIPSHSRALRTRAS